MKGVVTRNAYRQEKKKRYILWILHTFNSFPYIYKVRSEYTNALSILADL